jgi:hypothetical protein
VGAKSISPEETSRYAGGFNDPSKIASNFAGVSSAPDGGNEIVIRGNSPKYIQWRLEGNEITNPNHFGDQNAISGIVGALNNNILAKSDFYMAAFPSEFGNALSGIYDVRIRKGNNEKFEGILGLGLLGTDLTLEGPFKKGYKGSYLINYRYSTIGLANELNLVEVDGANLNFQDATYKMWLPTDKMGAFSIYGLQGKSGFTFEDVDPATWVTPGEDFIQSEVTKDFEKDASLFNTGLNHFISIGKKAIVESSLSYSSEGIKDRVFENIYTDDETEQRLQFQTDLFKRVYRLNSIFTYKVNAKHNFRAGLRYSISEQDLTQSSLNETNQRTYLADFNESIESLQSFASWKYSPNNQLSFVAGLHNNNILFNNKNTLEPRLSAQYLFNDRLELNLGYGNHSKMESIHNYFTIILDDEGRRTYPNLDLGLLRANHYVASLKSYITDGIQLSTEIYYQQLYNIPVENSISSSYSTLNEGLELNYVDLVNEGTGENYGVEINLERFMRRGFYFLLNASLYESNYTALDGVKRNTRFNGNYLVNLLAGKEFEGWGRKNNQIFGVNFKTHLGGGRHIIPLLRDGEGRLDVDPENGQIYDYSRAYETKLDDIVNVVLSLSYKWNKRSTTHELFLNIDNITNNRARLTEFYDTSAENGIGNERQVGIVPNVLYRFYF